MATEEEDATSSALEGESSDVVVSPDRYFEAKPIWKRMIVIVAGVTMNVLFALAVYIGLAWVRGETLMPITRVGAVIASALPAGGEELKQLKPGDRIVSINGTPVESWEDIRQQLVMASGTGLDIQLGDGRELWIPVHADAMGKRLQLADALEPFVVPVVGKVQPGSAAERAGIQPGDTLVRLDDHQLSQWLELRQILDSTEGQPVAVTVRRNGVERTLEVTPRVDSVLWYDSTMHVVGQLGVYVDTPILQRPYNFGQAVAAGSEMTLLASTQIFRAIKGILSGRVSGRSLGGPILIAQQAGQTAQLGLVPFLEFMALISVNLAVLNFLPIPVLDGGQFLFLVAEAVIRRPLSLKLRERLIGVGLVMILLLMVYVFSNDLIRVFGG
jgi:regulator of sigma E protease